MFNLKKFLPKVSLNLHMTQVTCVGLHDLPQTIFHIDCEIKPRIFKECHDEIWSSVGKKGWCSSLLQNSDALKYLQFTAALQLWRASRRKKFCTLITKIVWQALAKLAQSLGWEVSSIQFRDLLADTKLQLHYLTSQNKRSFEMRWWYQLQRRSI